MKKINNVTAKAVATGDARQNFEVADTQPRNTLPTIGMSRWRDIAPLISISREKFRLLVNAGKAPPAIRLSARCTCYANSELHKFFADPLHYRCEVK